jgi:DNA-binding response OmpR family regulator
VATFLLLTDGAPEQALPALHEGAEDVKVRSLATSLEEIRDLDPLVVIVDATSFPESAFALLQTLRSAELDSPLAVIARVEDLGANPWHLVTDELITRGATRAEVEVRMQILRKRASRRTDADLILGPLELDTVGYRASVGGEPLDLTYKEFELLKHLVSHPGRVYSREELLKEVWGYDFYGGARTVDVHVRRLRAKLGRSNEHLIETVRRVGYRAARHA